MSHIMFGSSKLLEDLCFFWLITFCHYSKEDLQLPTDRTSYEVKGILYNMQGLGTQETAVFPIKADLNLKMNVLNECSISKISLL